MGGLIQEGLSNTLRVMSNGLKIPVMILLVLLAAVTLFLLGTLICEIFMEHRHLKEKMPEMVDKIERTPAAKLPKTIEDSQLLRRQKDALTELTKHPQLTEMMRESLAVRLIAQERDFYDGRTRRTDLIAKVGPMLGLMGTLIPLGPGIIALGQGDTYTLSTSLLMAFDTTVAGLACAAVALVISNVRKRWYRNYMSMLETLMECTLEAVNKGIREENKAADAPANGPAEPADDTRKALLTNAYKAAYLQAVRQGSTKEDAVAIARQAAMNAAAGFNGAQKAGGYI